MTWLGTGVGWHGDANTEYLIWQGDCTSGGSGAEITTVDLGGALIAGLWNNSTTIDLTGAWWDWRPHSADQTDYTINLTVTWNGVTSTKTVSVTATDHDFPTGSVGTIVALDDGTFTLS